MPCGDGRSDKNLKTLAIYRLEMLGLILKDIIDESVPIKISDFEIQQNGFVPTWDILKLLKDEYPNNTFTFCIGSDLVNSLRSWDSGETLAEEQNFIIINRPQYSPDPNLYPKNYKILNTVVDGSSTAIRNRIREQIEKHNKLNLGINGLTTTSVIKFIKEKKLYQGNI